MPIYNIETTLELIEPLDNDVRADLIATFDDWSNVDAAGTVVTVTDREIVADDRDEAIHAANELLRSVVPHGASVVEQRVQAAM